MLMVSTTPRTNYYGLILAGGRGTRFWPRSRKARAKQDQRGARAKNQRHDERKPCCNSGFFPLPPRFLKIEFDARQPYEKHH